MPLPPPNVQWGSYGGNNPQSQVETLLHELAHLIRPVGIYGPNGLKSDLHLKDLFENDFGDSRNKTTAERTNGLRLLKYCSQFISSFPAR
jgi:hypothetical protein